MELEQVKLQTTWNDAARCINSNAQKIDIEVEKLKTATYKNKGYFKTLSDLTNAHPTASAGSRAYVGVNYPYAIYVWEDAWVNSGESGGDESLDLSQYYTKEEVDAAIANSIVFLSQSEYDALEVKEDKWYATYDE